MLLNVFNFWYYFNTRVVYSFCSCSMSVDVLIGLYERVRFRIKGRFKIQMRISHA
jgi:hypothetical protein